MRKITGGHRHAATMFEAACGGGLLRVADPSGTALRMSLCISATGEMDFKQTA